MPTPKKRRSIFDREEQRKAMNINEEYEFPLGKFYMFKALNPISIIPYFYW